MKIILPYVLYISLFITSYFSLGVTVSFEYDSGEFSNNISSYIHPDVMQTFDMQESAGKIFDSNNTTYYSTNYIGFTLDEDGTDISKAGIENNRLFFFS